MAFECKHQWSCYKCGGEHDSRHCSTKPERRHCAGCGIEGRLPWMGSCPKFQAARKAATERFRNRRYRYPDSETIPTVTLSNISTAVSSRGASVGRAQEVRGENAPEKEWTRVEPAGRKRKADTRGEEHAVTQRKMVGRPPKTLGPAEANQKTLPFAKPAYVS